MPSKNNDPNENRLSRVATKVRERWREANASAEPSWRLRPFWRLLGRRLRKGPQATTAYSSLPVLIKVFAGFSKVDGEVDEHDIDSSLGFLRYDYPEAIYSELRKLYTEALQESQDLNEIAADLATRLPPEEKILLGVQLYVLISSGFELHREQLIHFYLFMTNLGVASEAIDLVYQLNRDSEEEGSSEGIGQPLEVLRISGDEGSDLTLESLPPDHALLVFRFQAQILLKNIGSYTVIVRGRQLQQGEFCRLYEGQRVLVADAILNYQDLTFYFNAKKNLSTTQVFLGFESNGQPALERVRGKQSHLDIRFGLQVSVTVLRDTMVTINKQRLRESDELEVSLNDRIRLEDSTEIAIRDLHRWARELGGQFELSPSRSEYLVSNNPSQLGPGDLLLSEGLGYDVLLRITFDEDRKQGELEVLEASQPILVERVPVKDRAHLKEDATITLEEGRFLRCHFSERIIEEERNVISKLEIREVNHSFDGKETALDGITLAARRGEMICVIGPSGCGKSTLLRVLSGQLEPTQGQVGLNGFPLYQHHQDITPYISYVPQEDAFDPHLTIQENIDYAAAIRAPGVARRDRRRRVDSKLVELGLNERRHRLAGTPKNKFLSGGERKRLNVGMDMIGLADIYLFDEPTSGLSSKDSEHVLEIVQGLSRNKIVFVSIHQPSARLFQMFDKALLLDRGGKLAFFGKPEQMLQYFKEAQEENVVPFGQVSTTVSSDPDESKAPPTTPDFVFDVLETPLRDLSGAVIYSEDKAGHLAPARRFLPEFWRDRYQAHRTMREVKHLDPEDTRTQSNPPVLPKSPRRTWREKVTTLVTFFQRAFLSKLRNRGNLVTTLLEAPMLALLIALVLRWSEEERYTFGSAFHIPTYLFLSLVVAMFLGLTNSADEIIRDRALLTRERNLGSRLFAYLSTKILTLSIFAAIQSAIYVLVGNTVLEIRGMFVLYFIWLFLTSVCGVAIGLLVSCFVHDVKTALNIIPLIILPQIILGGALIKYQEMNRDLPVLSSLKRWTTTDTKEVENPLKVPLICEFMPLRWSYEALVISQGKYNPLASTLKMISAQEALFTTKPELTDEEAVQLQSLKEARTILLQLEAANGRKIRREVAKIHRRVLGNRFSSERYNRPPRDPYINVKQVFRNKKIFDLIDRSEMEVLDYRRDQTRPLNVFFGLEKTYFGVMFATVRINFYIMAIFILLSALIVWGTLKYQLTRT